MPEDRVLIRKIQAGDSRAFELLVKKYYQTIYRFALLRLNDRDLAYDFSQETFIRFHKNVNRFDADRKFLPYAFQIVKNLCTNYFERYAARMVSNGIDMLQQRSESAEDILIKDEMQTKIRETLNKLPDEDRLIIILKDFENYSYAEIAQEMGIPMGTVMSRLFYARKKLSNLLKGEYHADEL